MNHPLLLLKLTLMAGLLLGQTVLAQTIPVYSLAEAPAVDGENGDWSNVPVTTVLLRKTKFDGVTAVQSVAVRGGTFGDRMYILIEWKDLSENTVHKPWIWDEGNSKYLMGPQREDRFAIQFSREDAYTTDWRSGNAFTADTWHWKASRSNPHGLAHDKSLVVSRDKLLRAYKLQLPDGGHAYISRPSDAGDKLYKTKRYRSLEQPMMLKYVLTESPEGSVADVSAKGVWSDGKWRLELSRKLNTGNDDDVSFPLDRGEVKGGIAVFDRSENDDHAISETLVFDFLYQPWQSD
ncbi:MAG: hypothetical protein GY703_04440 [Gammaproteobacteria bacterium]|nr:hypothetical protein [Gammaproteobacteria bacterium]